MGRLFKLIGRNPIPEHESYLNTLRQALSAMPGDRVQATECLNSAFNAVECMAQSEIRYYNRRRHWYALGSLFWRTSGWFCGLLGTTIPLLAAADGTRFAGWALWGYPLLLLSAGLLGANSLFGGTVGHVRFVTTQLALERLATVTRLEWCALQRRLVDASDEKAVEDARQAMQNYADKIYTTTTTETAQWGENTLREFSELMAEMRKAANTRDRSARADQSPPMKRSAKTNGLKSGLPK